MDRRAITLQRLQAFCAVYERGSFSAAARVLAVSQPTISKHLRDLEAALKLSLFVLEGGRVSPTSEADWLYSESRFITDGLLSLTNRISGLRAGAEQSLSVACIGLLMHRTVPQALADLRAEMPEIELDVSVRPALEQLAALRSGQIDIGFCGGLVEAPDLQRRTIGQGHLVLLVPADHPLAGRAAISPDELSGLPDLIQTPIDRPIGRLLTSYLDNPAPGLAKMTCYSLEGMAPLVKTMGMVGVVDSFTATALSDPKVQVVPVDPMIRFDIHVFTSRPLARLRPALMLTKAMKEMLARG
jgi:DNA-binding transcriptional LysR family regulator